MNLVEELPIDILMKEKKEENKIYKLLASFSSSPKSIRTSELPSYCSADCGEDAFFTLETKNKFCLGTLTTINIFIGIADGVGGWRDLGVDPSIFAWELMNNCKKLFSTDPNLLPKKCLDVAYSNIIKEQKVYAGSSTACIVNIDKETGMCKTCNLGDSGLIVIRNDKIIFKSKEGTFYFNAPHQLSIIPKQYQNGLNLFNNIEDSFEEDIQLYYNDFIILATDGLFDNVFDYEIIDLLKKTEIFTEDLKCDLVENKICNFTTDLMNLAVNNSNSYLKPTPFSEEAENNGQYHTGGKIDDITFIAGLVRQDKSLKLVSHM